MRLTVRCSWTLREKEWSWFSKSRVVHKDLRPSSHCIVGDHCSVVPIAQEQRWSSVRSDSKRGLCGKATRVRTVSRTTVTLFRLLAHCLELVFHTKGSDSKLLSGYIPGLQYRPNELLNMSLTLTDIVSEATVARMQCLKGVYHLVLIHLAGNGLTQPCRSVITWLADPYSIRDLKAARRSPSLTLQNDGKLRLLNIASNTFNL